MGSKYEPGSVLGTGNIANKDDRVLAYMKFT